VVLAMRMVRRLAREFGHDLIRVFPPGADSISLMVRMRGKMRLVDDDDSPFLRFCLSHLPDSRSDLLQDLFVLHETEVMHGGVFVEFGAADGLTGSNSHLLETHYGWRGILVEPARSWHADLAKTRQCTVDHRCVTDRTGDSVLFRDCVERPLSTIESYRNADRFGAQRAAASRYDVVTVSLNDLLDEHGLEEIDYLSIDTEGSELMILAAFDFERFRPRVITVEHGYEPKRRAGLFQLLTRHGYRRKYESLSQIDDWYVKDNR
jgi:FkbM family methyltransferase